MMSINPIQNFNMFTAIPKPIPLETVGESKNGTLPQYKGNVELDANKQLHISTSIPMAFDSNHWYTLNPDGTVKSESCWKPEGTTYKSDKLKDLYNKVLKDYNNGPIESDKAVEISKQITEIIKNLEEG